MGVGETGVGEQVPIHFSPSLPLSELEGKSQLEHFQYHCQLNASLIQVFCKLVEPLVNHKC